MKSWKPLFIALCFLSVLAIAASAQGKTIGVAILGIEVKSDILNTQDPGLQDKLYNVLEGELGLREGSSSDIRVLERDKDKFDRLLKEIDDTSDKHKFNEHSKPLSGEMEGADFFIVGNVIDGFNVGTCNISLRIINVETGEIIPIRGEDSSTDGNSLHDAMVAVSKQCKENITDQWTSYSADDIENDFIKEGKYARARRLIQAYGRSSSDEDKNKQYINLETDLYKAELTDLDNTIKTALNENKAQDASKALEEFKANYENYEDVYKDADYLSRKTRIALAVEKAKRSEQQQTEQQQKIDYRNSLVKGYKEIEDKFSSGTEEDKLDTYDMLKELDGLDVVDELIKKEIDSKNKNLRNRVMAFYKSYNRTNELMDSTGYGGLSIGPSAGIPTGESKYLQSLLCGGTVGLDVPLFCKYLSLYGNYSYIGFQYPGFGEISADIQTDNVPKPDVTAVNITKQIVDGGLRVGLPLPARSIVYIEPYLSGGIVGCFQTEDNQKTGDDPVQVTTAHIGYSVGAGVKLVLWRFGLFAEYKAMFQDAISGNAGLGLYNALSAGIAYNFIPVKTR